MSMKACKSCYHITELDTCPLCSGELSKEWQGYVVIIKLEEPTAIRLYRQVRPKPVEPYKGPTYDLNIP